MEPYTKTLADYFDLMKRHKYYIIVTWLLVSLISVIVAYHLPKIYRSTATMLIEAPIPTKLFESTASQYADEQIQSIYQRVMTTNNVFSIIDAYDLYSDIKNDYTEYELAELFRDNTDVKLTTSSLTPNKTNSGMAEIAFDISFSDTGPTTAKEIAGELAALFIEQNDRARTQRAIKATDFLMEESNKLNQELQEIDRKIATYKEQNNFILPEQVQGNLAAIDRAEVELRDTDSQIRATKERVIFLAAELARAQQELPVVNDKASQNSENSLSVLRARYLRFSSIYSPSHPSVVRLKREIKALDPAFDGQPAEADVVKQLAEAGRELKSLEETYAGNHPDIAQHRKQIARLEQQLKSAPSRSQQEQGMASAYTINPAYLNVEAQYRSSQSELQSLMQKQDYLKAKLEKTQNTLLQAPQLEIGYTNLIRERDNTMKKYTQLKEKLLDAKLVQTMEEQEQGQTLTLIEQPAIPLHPEKAIRRKVAIGGFFIGIIAGLGVAFLVEFLDPGVRGYRAISEVTGLMPLVVVPYIESLSETEQRLVKQTQKRKMIVWTNVVLILFAIAVLMYFFFPSLLFLERNQ